MKYQINLYLYIENIGANFKRLINNGEIEDYKQIISDNVCDNFKFDKIRDTLEKSFPLLDEQSRRVVAGNLVIAFNNSAEIKNAIPLSQKTINRAYKEELAGKMPPKGRIRKPGGGRPSISASNPRFRIELEKLIEYDIAGDPMTNKKWVRKTLSWYKKQLNSKEIKVSRGTIRMEFKKLGISLKKNKKSINTRNHPDRNTQFEKIFEAIKKYVKNGWPIISVDTKKKELIGNFANPGKTWAKNPIDVLDHDFINAGKGKLVPYGIYDINRNIGYVHCGMSKDTPEFAVDSLVWWWENFGSKTYQNAKKLLILADSGGSNGYRPYKWKYDLQTCFADQFNIEITVAHYPSGTSKYNPIEHRLFSFISINWAGIPLESFELALSYINSTTTEPGLSVYAEITEKTYETGKTVSKEKMAALNLTRDEICPNWNYTITPRLSAN